ncbi:aldo/keto reductase [Desulfuromonas versatilis]|uniref:Aldo/keto reductase n=1 Tax=Desulfuromonas versatilis TaxID=2802975 RepID=A0ABN6DYR0_9BACT|nr:aldo/keto reductase [Desulfuromonas versatilis]BCR04271.1 aldo/keto reductase [Desulfuromonas versatilis]
MNRMKLGKTDLVVSEVGFGAIPIIRLETPQAVAVLRHAFERGINFYDTANAYRDSEEKIGAAFAGLRDQVVLATKTLRRQGAEVREHLERSLRMLRTDYLDLYQLHQIAQEQDWEAVSGPGGALEEAIRARAAGKIRYLGVTSHSLPMALKMLRTGLFDTIQFPFNFIEEGAAEELLPAARKLGMGFIVMKPFGGGAIDNAEVAFKFLRQHPDIVPIPGFESTAQIDEVLGFYQAPNRVSDADRALMERYRQELGKRFCRRCEYCQPCPRGVMITPAMGYRIVVNRMSPQVATEFCKVPMESVPQCNECGACIERCPYQLPVPEILKGHHELYLRHRAELEGPGSD